VDFEWVAIALGDVAWIAMAFALGFLARLLGLPPMVGFLATGFLLNAQGIPVSNMMAKMADLGITLLLFTVGLKLNLPTLARPQVWAVAGLHMAIVAAVFGAFVFWLATAGIAAFSELDGRESSLVAFALSFSSTVFAVKVLEEKGEMRSLHGRIAIGILIMQDLAAVVFMTMSETRLPSPWALLLTLLFVARPLLNGVLDRLGHGELLVLYGLLLALGGAELFELVGLKEDLGALVLGVLMANHPRSQEVARTMLGFKDLFLLGFFLSIGMSGQPTVGALVTAAILALLVLLKSALFLVLLTRFRLRARTALLSTLSLTSYSEFGLIVAALGVDHGWLGEQWLIVIALTLSLSFAIAAIINARPHALYARYRESLQRLQHRERLPDDRLLDTRRAWILVIGMGRVGTGAYDEMYGRYGDTVLGIDSDPVRVARHVAEGRNVVVGDPSDADFWDRVEATHMIRLVLLALPQLRSNLSVLNQLEAAGFDGRVAATARFPDDVEALREAGVDTVFNIYTEAGAGFAAHVTQNILRDFGIEERHGA
jgi:predicted Kef-type K+ transport protein